MAIYKCKMCGGTLEITGVRTVGTCEYCGTKQSLPRANCEQDLQLFNRANQFRLQCEFDKAAEIYEKMASHNSEDPDLYWSIVLCRYGIEYVDDPATKKKIPTCHRMQFRSILDDPDYHTALEHCDMLQRNVFERDAKYIDSVQKSILEISNKEEPFDVFICYKESDENGRRTHDSQYAQDIYYGLTQEGFKVFFSRITLESRLGTEYEPYIFSALNSAKVMVIVGTKPEYFNSVWVRNEWSRYLLIKQSDPKRVIIPAYKDMDPYDLPSELSMFQSQDMSKLGFMQDLIRGIKKIIRVEPETPVPQHSPAQQSSAQNSGSVKELVINGGLYIGETFAGKPNGNGRMEYADGRLYEGEWRLGKRHGMGKLVYIDGEEFVGEFRDNRVYAGSGTVLYDDGSSYTGEYAGGHKNGRGKIVYPDGGTREGEFKDGNFIRGKEISANGDVFEGDLNGHGKFTCVDGSCYEGEFKDGNPVSGKGTLVLSDSEKYTGEFNINGMHGNGVLVYADGTKCEGEFRDNKPFNVSGAIVYEDGRYTGKVIEGKREGRGVFVSNDGSKIEGEFRDDKPFNVSGTISSKGGTFTGTIVEGKKEGKGHLVIIDSLEYNGYFKNDVFYEGEIRIPNGSVYKGTFEKDGQTLIGVFTHPNGSNLEGEFRYGKIYSGKGTLIFSDGRYTGEFFEGKKHGKGRLETSDGQIIDGNFVNDKACGYGTITKADGTSFKGNLLNNKCHGAGVFTDKDGTRYTGKWENGKKIGNFMVYPSDGSKPYKVVVLTDGTLYKPLF